MLTYELSGETRSFYCPHMTFPIIAALMVAAFAAPSVTTATVANAPLMAHTPQTLEEYVRDYYIDEPILAEIARCESTFRQLDSKGEVLRGKINKSDIGVMQINLFYHEDSADKMELDLESLEGNLAYAKHLYEKEGTVPWASSAPCWNKKKPK